MKTKVLILGALASKEFVGPWVSLEGSSEWICRLICSPPMMVNGEIELDVEHQNGQVHSLVFQEGNSDIDISGDYIRIRAKILKEINGTRTIVSVMLHEKEIHLIEPRNI